MTQIYAQLPSDVAETLSTTAGIVLGDFDPNGNLDAEAIRKNILFATDGGVNTTCVYTYSDFAEGLDNAPTNTKQLLRVESVACGMSGTAKTITKDVATRFLGHADAVGLDVVEITPRKKIEMADFKTYWHVCPYGTQGGFVAVKLADALNTGGFNWQSENNGKGSFPFSFAGYSNLENPDEIPFKFYLKTSATAPTQNVEPTQQTA